jgi:hypothetical protein
MKMARMYKHDDIAAVEKLFKKTKRRFKGEKGTILYALYAWILVKKNRVDDAIVLLDEAKKETEDATLAANWDHLVNGRARSFSNAGLGDLWYSLHLETPKPIKVRQRRGRMR